MKLGNGLQLMLVFAVITALVISFPVQSAFSETGFSNVKKSTGIIMKFCINEEFTLQDCKERYEGIGWTDRINVIIYAPGWNNEDDRIEQIGGSSNPIDVYTDVARVDNVEFDETGPDTGIFMGVVKLTGKMNYTVHDTYVATVTTPGMTMDPDGQNISSHDRAVMIATSPQDGRVTVAWEPNEDEFVSKSAYYGWQIGEAHFDKDTYDVNEKVTFFIRDNDLWKHHVQFFSNYVKVYSESDPTGIFVGVQFVKNMNHAKVDNGFNDIHLTEPAANSLTKYTPDGEWKTYLWWEPGGVLGVNQEYDLNLMVHDGLTDIHEMGLSYNMDIYLNGGLIESRTDRYSVDGQGIEPIVFTERGSAKIVISDIFDQGQEVSFSFQVAPDAILEEVVPRHGSFEVGNTDDPLVGYEHPHHFNYLPGEFTMTTSDSSDDRDELRVSPGDTIFVEYEDITLPKPFTSSDRMDIIAKSLVLDSGFNFATNPSEAEIFVESPVAHITPTSANIEIPSWVKKNAALWSDGQINDPDFTKGIEYLVQENIIDIQVTQENIDEESITTVPLWFKNNAAFWSAGHITDVEFVDGIKYLIFSGLIKV